MLGHFQNLLHRVRGGLASPRLPLLAAVLSVVLCLPALVGGFVMDDWFQRAVMMNQAWTQYFDSPLRGMFCFMPGAGHNRPLIDLGILPWWADPDVRACFLRPVAVLSHQLDFALWRDQAWLQHAHSLAWWGLGVWLIGRLYRQILPGALAAAGLATLLFALADDHAMVVGWIAGRNGLLALVIGTLCLSLHIGGRRVAALFAAVIGLGVGEPFIGALAYLAAWELTRADPLRVKLARLLPYAILLLGWRLWYQVEGYGAANSGLYVDPGRQPLRFLLALADRAPWMAAGQTLGLPVDMWILLRRPAQILVAGAAVLSVGALCWLLAPLFRGSRPAAFLALGSLLALVPPCGAFPTARLMLWSGIGFFGLLGLAARRLQMLSIGPAGAEDAQRSGEPTGRARWQRRVVMALLGLHLILSGMMLPGRLLLWPALGGTLHAGALQAPHDAKLAEQTLVFVNGSELMVSYAAVIREVIEHSGERGRSDAWLGPAPRRVALLSSMMTDCEIERVDDRTLRLRPEGGFLSTTMDQMFRGADKPFQLGERIRRPDLSSTVVSLTEDGRPASVLISFDEPLDSGAYRFVAVVGGQLQPWIPPAPGQRSRLRAGWLWPTLRPLGAHGPLAWP